MDWTSIILFAVIIFALFWLIMRLRGNVRNPPKLQIAMELISALNDDLKIIHKKQTTPGDLQKFKTGNWKSFQHHLDFLEKEYKEYIEPLKSVFSQMVDYNNKLVEMKINQDSTGHQIDLENLKSEIVLARAGLAKWIQANVHREATRGMFSWRN